MNISRGCALLVDITRRGCASAVGTGEHFQNRSPRCFRAGTNRPVLWITGPGAHVPYAAAGQGCPQSTAPTTTTDNSFFLELEIARLP